MLHVAIHVVGQLAMVVSVRSSTTKTLLVAALSPECSLIMCKNSGRRLCTDAFLYKRWTELKFNALLITKVGITDIMGWGHLSGSIFGFGT